MNGYVKPYRHEITMYFSPYLSLLKIFLICLNHIDFKIKRNPEFSNVF